MPHHPDKADLRLVTPHHDTTPCDGSYTCECPACRAEVTRRVAIGVRSTPKPLKRAA